MSKEPTKGLATDGLCRCSRSAGHCHKARVEGYCELPDEVPTTMDFGPFKEREAAIIAAEKQRHIPDLTPVQRAELYRFDEEAIVLAMNLGLNLNSARMIALADALRHAEERGKASIGWIPAGAGIVCPRCGEERDGFDPPDGCRDPNCPMGVNGKAATS